MTPRTNNTQFNKKEEYLNLQQSQIKEAMEKGLMQGKQNQLFEEIEEIIGDMHPMYLLDLLKLEMGITPTAEDIVNEILIDEKGGNNLT
mgnify:CR=1 FL=1|jgi:hypothetical protein